MTAVRALGAALHGVDAVPIEVEVDLLRRLPSVCIVGLAACAVRESAERVRSAIAAADLEFPRKRVVINLAPADVRKEGAALDLPIAVAILAADDLLPAGPLAETLLLGELSLDGQLRPIRGALSVALLARELGRTLILPRACAERAAAVPGVTVLAADDLGQVVRHLRGEQPLDGPGAPERGPAPSVPDLADVRGQALARRALEIAAAGAHHLLLVGPPGCGKSMLARRLPGILPPLSFEEALDTSRVHSAAGLADGGVALQRPFRAPHHSVTVAGMIGDRTLRPGEVSLAHNGVLFLDEAPEFGRSVLEILRTPLEDGVVQVTRAIGTVTYPAALTLVMAANPCPCGYRGSDRPCLCTDTDVARYRRRLSGPIVDRVDLHLELDAVPVDRLLDSNPGEASEAVRQRVVEARRRQRARGQAVPNGQLTPEDCRTLFDGDPDALGLLRQSATTLGLSGRAATRVQKVARTIADLAGSRLVRPDHVAEALAFRASAEVP